MTLSTEETDLMNKSTHFASIRLLTALLCLLLLLTGCGRLISPSPSPVQEAEAAASSEPEPVSSPLPEPTPEPEPVYDLDFSINGQPVSADMTAIDLSQAQSAEVDRLISVLPALSNLTSIELGSAAAESPAISWDQVYALRTGAPQAEINYHFTVQGYAFSLTDEILNLNHIPFSDDGILAWKIANCMPNLQILDMDSCNVSNQHMAAIRDGLPGIEVVWRVWFGIDYSVRTNVDRIVASNPDRGGHLIGDAAEGLNYCTKVKYLDLGHNDLMSDISFIANMPELEVLIVSMCGVKDISALANCPNLNYLELFTCGAADLTPLSGLTKLRDLNLCDDFALCDIRPLYNLDLDRLWLGRFDPVPKEQIEEFKRLHPNCIVNTTTEDPVLEEWRHYDAYYPVVNIERYTQLRQEFQYDNFPACYAYTSNDPKVWGRFEYY